jgi:hypothetical protein
MPATLLRSAHPDKGLVATRRQSSGHPGRGGQVASLPDVDSATAAVYVDLRKVADISGDELPAQVEALRSVGLTASSSGDETAVHLRLVAG